MRVFAKIIVACIIGGLWYHIIGTPDDYIVSFLVFVGVLFILLIKPVSYQDPQQRDEFRLKIREAREKKAAIVKKQLEEKAILRQQMREAEEERKRELRRKLKL